LDQSRNAVRADVPHGMADIVRSRDNFPRNRASEVGFGILSIDDGPKFIVDVPVNVVRDPNPVCIRVQQALRQGFAGVARLARSLMDEEQYYKGHQNDDRGLPHAATPVWLSTNADGSLILQCVTDR
jgi:hypothetical protein